MEPGNPQAPVLVAFDPRDTGRAPVEFGVAVCHVTGAPLVVASVARGGSAVERVTAELEGVKDELAQRGVAADARVAEGRTVGAGLTGLIEELRPQLVVLGSPHGRGVRGVLLGDTSEQVVHAANCPVAAVPQDYQRPPAGIRLVGAAYTPTPEGRYALEFAADLARAANVGLRVIEVLDPAHAADQSGGMLAKEHHDQPRKQEARAAGRLHDEADLQQLVATRAAGVPTDIDVLFNDPAEGLIAATPHVDLLVMGSRARPARRAAVLGSVAHKVAEHTACPVVILPRGQTEEADELLTHVAGAPVQEGDAG